MVILLTFHIKDGQIYFICRAQLCPLKRAFQYFLFHKNSLTWNRLAPEQGVRKIFYLFKLASWS